MILIDSPEMLSRFFPNAVPAVKGEKNLYDKISAELAAAETYIAHNVADVDTLRKYNSNIIAPLTYAVAAQAVEMALPKLDVILTANGLGVVQTATIGAASEHRTKSLRKSLRAERDRHICNVLRLLPKDQGWVESSQGRFWLATIFPNPDDLASMDSGSGLLENYSRLRPAVIGLEMKMEECFVGRKLFRIMRRMPVNPPEETGLSAAIGRLLDVCRGIMVETLSSGRQEADESRLYDVVGLIRSIPQLKSIWDSDPVSRYFKDFTYHNTAGSGGYFFG